jgi:hypothetical protein
MRNSEFYFRIHKSNHGLSNRDRNIFQSAFRIPHSALFYVLRLFSQLLDFGLDLDSRIADRKLRRFREDRVRLAVDFLKQEIELLAGIAVARKQILRLRQMALQARDLFRDVAAFGKCATS